MIIALIAAIVAIILHVLAYEWAKLIDRTPKEYDKCRDCECVWCYAEPGDKECRRWRREHEGRGNKT